MHLLAMFLLLQLPGGEMMEQGEEMGWEMLRRQLLGWRQENKGQLLEWRALIVCKTNAQH